MEDTNNTTEAVTDTTAVADIPDFVRRLIDEGVVLSARLGRLTDFMEGPVYAGLDPKRQGLLVKQKQHMEGYLHILAVRTKLELGEDAADIVAAQADTEEPEEEGGEITEEPPATDHVV
jgi:hypothetical protein